MRIFLFLAVLFILISFIYKLISFVVFKYRLSKKTIVFVQLPGYKTFNRFYFLGGIAASIAGFVFYRIYELEYIIVLWNILAITQVINSFISPDGYLVFSAKGIRKHYNEKLLRWEIIHKLEINGSELAFYYGNKELRVYVKNNLALKEITKNLQEQRKDVYDRLFNN